MTLSTTSVPLFSEKADSVLVEACELSVRLVGLRASILADQFPDDDDQAAHLFCCHRPEVMDAVW